MGWEVRGENGRRYLYRSIRRRGRPVKEYVSADDDFGAMMAERLESDRLSAALSRAEERRKLAEYRAEIDAALIEHAKTDEPIRAAIGMLMVTNGFHRTKRGPWRKRRGNMMASGLKKVNRDLAALIEKLKGADQIPNQLRPPSLLEYAAPASDAEAVELFRKARAGGEVPSAQLEEFIRQRGWVQWIGDIGRQATVQLISKATDYDEVWKAGVVAKVAELRKSLLGDNPTPLDELVVRRVVNAWLVVARLELESVHRAPTDPRKAEYLDRAISRAQKRLLEAVRSLAAIRRVSLRVVQKNAFTGSQINVIGG